MTLQAVGDESLVGAVGVGGSYGAATALSNGKYVVAWTNTVSPFVSGGTVSDTSGSAIVARVLNADGTPAGAAFQVNTEPDGFQTDPEIVALSNGNFAIAWTDGPGTDGEVEAKARIFAADGSAVTGEIQLATTTDGDQRIPQLMATDDGGFYAVWQDSRGSYTDVSVAQQFAADGTRVGQEVFVGFADRLDAAFIAGGPYDRGDIRILSNNTIDSTDGSSYLPSPTSTFAQFNTSNHTAPGDLSYQPAVVGMAGGRYAWVGVQKVGTEYRVSMRVYDAANYNNAVANPGGSYSGDTQFLISTNAVPVGAVPSVQAVGLTDGGILVVWAELGGTAESPDYNIMAQLYDANLNAVGGNQQVHTGVAGHQVEPFVAQGADGKVLIGWTDDTGSLGGLAQDLHVRLFSTSGSVGGTISGTGGDDVLTGTTGADKLVGKAGNDKLYGEGGNDTLLGGDGRDLLHGGGGRDVMKGGAGNDIYIVNHAKDKAVELAGEGTDTVKSSVDHTLQDNLERLVLTGAKAIDGTGNKRRNRIVGNDQSNVLRGGNGADTLLGKGGNDVLLGDKHADRLTGGGGSDKFKYARALDGGDTITDFTRGQGDKLVFVSKNFGALTKGELAAGNFVANAGGLAQDGNDFFVFDTTSKTLYFDADGSGAGAAVKIATFSNGVTLKNTDIVMG